MARKRLLAPIGVISIAVALAGCSGGGASADNTIDGTPEGEITVLTQRTDIVDTVFADYAEAFEEKYPDVSVKFEAITDYEGEVATRLNTDDYGDVLLIPNAVTKDQLPGFFEPLGSVDELSKKYRFLNEQAFDGDAYGIAITGNAQGIVYNKKVWEAAGVTDWPTTPDEFLTDLKAIDDATDAIPYYTNYADEWPLSQWDANRGLTGNAEANLDLVDVDAPWSAETNTSHFLQDGLLFDIVNQGLSEDDPLTTNWEESKNLLGQGKVASMLLGSWSITQMQDAAVAAGGAAEDIGYMPFPYQVDGAFHSTASGDYKNAINVNSEHKAAAFAWIDWFANESGYAESNGGLSPIVDGAVPDTLADFDAQGVEYVELEPLPNDRATAETDIASAAEIDLTGGLYRQELVDVARGAADGTKESFFADLNTRWADARSQFAG